MAAQRPLVGALLLQERVLMIGEELFGHRHIDLALVRRDELPPSEHGAHSATNLHLADRSRRFLL